MGGDRLTATRGSYDVVAEEYAELLRGHLGERPTDGEVLARFADEVRAGSDDDGRGDGHSGAAVVGDLGCGPGRLFDALGALGLEVVGVDLSPAMVRVARRDHPGRAAIVGSLDRLPLATGSLAGALAWYSTIHTSDDDLPAMFAEVHRVLRPDGIVVAAFQVGDEVRRHTHLYGHDLDLHSHRRSPDDVAAAAGDAGLTETWRLVRPPAPDEDCSHAYLFLRSGR